jgi:hypothetical protein
LFNKKVEPVSGRWYTEEETDILDHQPVQGNMDNNAEEGTMNAVAHQVYLIL